MYTNFSFFKRQRLSVVRNNIKTSNQFLLQFNIDEKFASNLPHELKGGGLVASKRLIIGVYDSAGKTIFENDLLRSYLNKGIKKDFKQEWQTIDEEKDIVQVYTHHYPDINRIVMTGNMTDKGLLNLDDIREQVWLYVIGIVLVLTVVSALATKFLMTPLRRVADYLAEISEDGEQLKQVEFNLSPETVVHNDGEKSLFPDEFKSLVLNLNRFTDSVRTNFRLSKRSTLLLAHELKTPMTILRNTLEQMRSAEDMPSVQVNVQEAVAEVERLDRIVAEFMDWTILDNNFSDRKNIHAIKLKKATQDILDRHNSHGDAIIVANLEDDMNVFANPLHFDLLVDNLINNALKYSDRKPLAIKLSQGILQIEDQGQGIPDEVMKNLGKPFNTLKRKGQPRGTGLGLAWIMTICKRYNWKIRFIGSPTGTTVVIDFNELENSH